MHWLDNKVIDIIDARLKPLLLLLLLLLLLFKTLVATLPVPRQESSLSFYHQNIQHLEL